MVEHRCDTCGQTDAAPPKDDEFDKYEKIKWLGALIAAADLAWEDWLRTEAKPNEPAVTNGFEWRARHILENIISDLVLPPSDDWEPTISFADVAAKFPDHPWEVADDQGREYRVDRVAPTVDGTLVIWVVPLAHPEDAVQPSPFRVDLHGSNCACNTRPDCDDDPEDAPQGDPGEVEHPILCRESLRHDTVIEIGCRLCIACGRAVIRGNQYSRHVEDAPESSVPPGGPWLTHVLAAADAIIAEDYDEAYHQLYAIVEPTFTKPGCPFERLRERLNRLPGEGETNG